MKLFVSFVLFYSIFSCGLASELPVDLQRCSLKDLTCLKAAVQDALPKLKDGIPELGVPSLDPLKIAKMSIGSGNIIQLVQNYENFELIGLSTVTLNELSFDLDKGKLFLGITAPLIVLKATYTVKGKILVLDVYGHGNCTFSLENETGSFSMDLETYTKNDQMYIKGTNPQFEFDTERCVFNFENLFDGNKLLGDNINQVLNDNWREIFNELRGAYGAVIGKALGHLTNKLFETTSVNDMFI
ncbi:hypothetical protein HHI36_022067 [Cryptolaemus montrouzieri]|uniref:Uncharacterized protein n=1 Tax=Cryptolaemus montrouzieri TaxID=559131 RepID=A0ABD2MZ29_9CUCU